MNIHIIIYIHNILNIFCINSSIGHHQLFGGRWSSGLLVAGSLSAFGRQKAGDGLGSKPSPSPWMGDTLWLCQNSY